MKKILFIVPLMAISFLTNCGGGSKVSSYAIKMGVTVSESEVVSFNCWPSSAFTVDWGDKIINSEKSHQYQAGTYHIQIDGVFKEFKYTSENRDNLTSLDIGNIKYLANHSFENCSKLTTVTFADNTPLETLDEYCFRGCTSLSSIVLPSSLKTIGENSFSGDTTLQTVSFAKDSKLESISTKAFASCTSLSLIEIPDNIKKVRHYSFNNCVQLTYKQKDNINYLGNSVHPYLVAMSTIDKQLTSYTLDDNCRIIASEAFSDCTNLVSITIPSKVIGIGDDSFRKNSNLEEVIFNNGSNLETIGEAAFKQCSKLTSIKIPSTITSIDQFAFDGCPLTYNPKGDINYLGNDSNPYLIAIKLTEGNQSNSYIMDDRCRIIYDRCFYISNLTSIIFSNSLISIGAYAFGDCDLLSTIEIPHNVISIDSSAFWHSENLKTITFADDCVLETIGTYIFEGCTNLTSITLPYNLKKIGRNAFKNCSNLVMVDLTKINEPPISGLDVFLNHSPNLRLCVPNALLDEYRTSLNWEQYANYFIAL